MKQQVELRKGSLSIHKEIGEPDHVANFIKSRLASYGSDISVHLSDFDESTSWQKRIKKLKSFRLTSSETILTYLLIAEFACIVGLCFLAFKK